MEQLAESILANASSLMPEPLPPDLFLAAGDGKRLRPTLHLLCTRLCGYRGPHDVVLATVLERTRAKLDALEARLQELEIQDLRTLEARANLGESLISQARYEEAETITTVGEAAKVVMEKLAG